MNDLKSFVTLQARLFEFLARQDETTLRAIAGGTAQLAVIGAEAAPAPSAAPSSDPRQVALELSTLPTESERRIYLNSAKLLVKQLREVAVSMGVPGYRSLTKPKLIALLAGHHTPKAAEAAPSTPVNDSPKIDAPEKVERPGPDVEAVGVASHLRELETEEEGAAYLREQRLDREALLAVAAELQLTRVTRLTPAELEKRVLKQAIGARRKFAGLRKW